MNDLEFLALLFIGFLAAIVFGIFTGIAINEQRKDRERTVKVNRNLEAVREGAFARLNRAGSSRSGQNILDADVIE